MSPFDIKGFIEEFWNVTDTPFITLFLPEIPVYFGDKNILWFEKPRRTDVSTL